MTQNEEKCVEEVVDKAAFDDICRVIVSNKIQRGLTGEWEHASESGVRAGED